MTPALTTPPAKQATRSAHSPPRVAVVLPCYRVTRAIETVVRGLPAWVAHIIAVDDACPDGSGELLETLARDEPRLRVLHHDANQGVGGAMATGFAAALDLDVDLVVKMDGDGQMDPAYLPTLLLPLLEGRADYAKGNRFRHVPDLRSMPWVRLAGNLGLTFLTKVASGCWHVFDPQNGYLAITREALALLPLQRVDKGYTFENWMLTQIGIHDLRVIDVPIPARYGDEVSSLRVHRALIGFPLRLSRLLLERLVFKYVLFDLSPIALYLLCCLGLFGFAGVFGGYHWWRSVTTEVAAPTGTVALALLPALMGFQLFLHAVDLDIRATPKPLPPRRPLTEDDVVALLADEASEPARGEA